MRTNVLGKVTAIYFDQLAKMLQVEESLKRFQKKTVESQGMSIEQKVKLQVSLDVQEFRRLISNQQITPDSIQSMDKLLQHTNIKIN